MKIIIKYIFLAVVFSSLLVSCEPEDQVDVDSRDKIVGQWKCDETSQAYGPQVNYVVISKENSDSTKIYIDNFFGLGTGKIAYALVNNLTVSIPLQMVDGQQVNGSGTIAGSYKSMNLTYTVDDGGGVNNVSAAMTKL